jgi:hypothetical protein
LAAAANAEIIDHGKTAQLGQVGGVIEQQPA